MFKVLKFEDINVEFHNLLFLKTSRARKIK